MSFFFFNDTATTEIYTLSLHDALPILLGAGTPLGPAQLGVLASIAHATPLVYDAPRVAFMGSGDERSEEHTSELQSLAYLVCRLLLEKKKTLASEQAATEARRRRMLCI